jgi:YHS domain-containing protein
MRCDCGAWSYEEATMVTDPVCKMTIDESKAAGKSEYGGKTYYFCALSCKARFDANPSQYVKQA